MELKRYVPRGCTYKPCPGCGEEELRTKDRLCPKCQSIYDNGIRLMEAQDKKIDEVAVTHCNVPHWLSGPYIYEGKRPGVLKNWLRKSWANLTMLLLKPGVNNTDERVPRFITDKEYMGKKRIHVSAVKNAFSANEIYTVRKDIRDAINDFDLIVRLGLEYMHLSGYCEGLDNLIQLNQGCMSNESYQEKISRMEARINDINDLAIEMTSITEEEDD